MFDPHHPHDVQKSRRALTIQAWHMGRVGGPGRNQSNQIKFIKHTSNVYASIEIKRNTEIYNSLNMQ